MKIIKLIQNETIKTWKKTSTKILVLLSILMIFAALGFSKLVVSLGGMVISSSETSWQEFTKEEIEMLKVEIETNKSHYDKATIAEMKAELETYELSLKYNVNYTYGYGDDWKYNLLSEIQSAKTELAITNAEEQVKIKEQEQIINKNIKLLETNNYQEYIKIKKEEAKAKFNKKEITEEAYNDEIYFLDLQAKYEIFKETDDENSWKKTIYSDIEVIKTSLDTGINSRTGKLLKIEEIEELEEKLKIDLYRLENGIHLTDGMASERSIYDAYAPSFALIMVSILMIIITGSSISTEVSKGTIKFLLFTPNKRWKILLSKLISAMVILLALSLILSTLTFIIRKHLYRRSRNRIPIRTKWRSKSNFKLYLHDIILSSIMY